MISKELKIAISTALARDDATRLSELLEQHNLGVNDQILIHGKTVLMYSAENGATNCMKLLLERPDIDVNAVDTDIGNTALMHAVEYGRTESVRLLLAREDLNINQQNCAGGNVMDSATICANAECLKLLLSHKSLDIGNNGRTSIARSAHNNNPELVKLLLQLGFDIDSVCDSASGSSTALMFNSKINNPELVKLLLDNGADINLTDEQGESALKKAIERVNLAHDFQTGGDAWHESESLRLLVSYGAELPDAVTVNAATTIPQTRLQTFTTIKTLTSLILQADAALTPQVVRLAAKITIHDLFSPNVAPATLVDSPVFLEACMRQAKITAQTIWDRISGYEESTQEFILNNAHFIDFSLGEDFKSWKVAEVGVKTTLVNLAYVCGGPVAHIESLIGSKPQKIEKFMELIPLDEDGNILEYSAGEFAFRVVSSNATEKLAEKIASSAPQLGGTNLEKHILGYLSYTDLPTEDTHPDIIGDGLTHGLAAE